MGNVLGLSYFLRGFFAGLPPYILLVMEFEKVEAFFPGVV